MTIFTWRLLAKSLLHVILPPTFRLLARGFSLPHRRFYTPATDYKNVPSEFSNSDGLGGLRAVPSVIDLPMTGVGVEIDGADFSGREVEVSGIGRGRGDQVKMRSNGQCKDVTEKNRVHWGASDKPLVKHYDADG